MPNLITIIQHHSRSSSQCNKVTKGNKGQKKSGKKETINIFIDNMIEYVQNPKKCIENVKAIK